MTIYLPGLERRARERRKGRDAFGRREAPSPRRQRSTTVGDILFDLVWVVVIVVYVLIWLL